MSRRMSAQMPFYQISLFDDLPTKAMAINCLTQDAIPTDEPEPWMLRLVPDGIFSAVLGNHPLVLRPKKGSKRIPAGFEYCHYLVDGVPYVGIFVG